MWEKQINCSTRQSWRELIPTNVIFIVLYKGPGDLLLALFVSFTEIIHLEGRLVKRWLCFGCLRLMWNDGIVLLMWNDGIVFLGLEGKEILLWRLLEGKEIVCLRLHGRRVLEMMSNYFLLVAFGDAPSPSLRRVFFFGGCLKNCLNGNPAELSLRWQGTLPRLRLWRTRGYGVSRNECSLLASLPGEHLLGNWWPTFGQQDCRRHGGTFFTTSTCQPGKTPSNDKNKKCDARTPSRQAVRPFLKMSIWRGILPGPTHANLEPTHRCDGCSCIILSLEW